MKKLYIAVVFLFCCVLSSLAYAEAKHYEVIAYPSKPFMIFEGSEVTGFSKDLLDEMAKDMNFTYHITEVKNVAGLLEAVKSGKGDFGITSVSITSQREEYVDFSHAIYDSGLDIIVHEEKLSTFGMVQRVVRALLSEKVLKTILYLIGIVLFAAHIIWIVERNSNPAIPKTYLKGLFESVWWAAVTVTTVGYGDKTPNSYMGRSFAMVWMFSGIFFISFFTATITSSLTIDQLRGSIRGPQDLPGKLIGSVKGTTSADYLRSINATTVYFSHISEALDAFGRNEVEAVVYDQPLLKYYEITKGKGKSKVIGNLFEQQQYGIVFPQGSALREQANYSILKVKESGRYAKIMDKWFK